MQFELRAFGNSAQEIIDRLDEMAAEFGAAPIGLPVITFVEEAQDLHDLSKEYAADCVLYGSIILDTSAPGALAI